MYLLPLQSHYPEALTLSPFGVLRELQCELGQPIYVVGGYVRDYLRCKPVKDIDIVTVGSGLELARRFAERVGPTEVSFYDNFGTALVRANDCAVEFVGARRESYRRDSRKPIVEDGSLRDDQLRRDFTINALSLSLAADDWGRFIDPFGGYEDLARRRLRTPRDPDLTFSDDPLRMLRAARFAAVLDCFIDETTFAALERNRDRLPIVSPERIAEELNKMMMAAQPSKGWLILFKSKLLPLILPELQALHGVDRVNGIGHKDNFFHTLKVLDNLAELSDSLWLRWAALLHDIAKPLTKRFEPGIGWTFHGHEDRGARLVPQIFRRLRLPQNEKMRFVQLMVQLHQRPIALADSEVTDSAIRRLIVDAGEHLDELLLLCRADITTRDTSKLFRFRANYDALEARIREVEERDALRNWQPPISGELIMETFGLKPGPAVGAIKNAIREAILEGEIPNDYEAAYAYMQRIAPPLLDRHPPRA